MTKMQVPFGQRQIEHQRRLAPLTKTSFRNLAQAYNGSIKASTI
jgi:hypothetical protein